MKIIDTSRSFSESSTVKFEIPDNNNGLCSKLIIDTDLPPDFNKHRTPKAQSKINANSDINGTADAGKSNSLEKTGFVLSGKVPIFKDSFMQSAHSNQQQQQQQQHSIMQTHLNTQPTPPTIQLVPDSAVSIKNNLLNYLLSSISRVNMANNNSNNPDLAKSLSVNVSMPTGPLNLSQSYNKLADDQIPKKEKFSESGKLILNFLNIDYQFIFFYRFLN